MENDNLNEKLSQILNDPKGMAQIQSLAQSLFGGEKSAEQTESIGKGEMDILMRAAKMLRSDRPDDRSQLLLALKPHLSGERRERVDRAVKLLRIAKLAPLLGETDLFKF